MERRSARMLVLWVGAAALLACSGHYEVGGMNREPFTEGAAGSLGPGGGGSGGAGGSGAGSGGGSECDNYPSDPPPILLGTFAEPAVVWERISLMVHGEVVAPPSTLPAVATAEWAGSIALQAFGSTTQLPAGAPLVRRYLSSAFRLAEDSALPALWAPRISGDVPVLETLYVTPLTEPGRVGILSEPEWLTRHSRIVSRGVTILSSVLNTPAPAPPPSVITSLPPESAEGLTERERLARHRNDPVCAACHNQIDPFGFALSHFDANGAYRTTENGAIIDSSGTVAFAYDPELAVFTGIEDLAPQLAQSCTARLGFADANLRLALAAAIELNEHEPFPEAWIQDRERVRWAFVRGKTYASLVSAIAQTNPILR